MKIKHQLLLIILSLSLIPLLVVTLSYDVITKNIVYNNVEKYYRQTVNARGMLMEKELLQIENSLTSITLNQILCNQLYEYKGKSNIERVNAILDIRRIGETAMVQNPEIVTVIFYIPEGNKIEDIGEKREENYEDAVYYVKYFKDYFRRYKAGTVDHPTWHYDQRLGKERIALLSEIKDLETNSFVGMLAFIVNIEQMETWMEEMALSMRDVITFSLTEGENLIEVHDTNAIETLREQNEVILTAQYPLSMGFTLTRSMPFEELTTELNDVRQTSLTLILVILIFATLIAIRFSNRLSQRFGQLIGLMSKVKKGNLNIKKLDIPHNQNETNQIFHYFYDMVGKLETSIHENYVLEIENKEARLQALQYQINPHFLFNTLSAIHALAELDGQEEISRIANNLGEVFRYNMNKEGMKGSLLKDELAHVQHYMYIQNILHNGRIQFFEDVPEEFSHVLVPRFILQPLVENAIIHGFKETYGEGCIELTAMIEEGELIIAIADDGKGCKEMDQLEFGIGLRNVQQRLVLAYGPAYGVTLINLKPGCKVTLRIPHQTGGELYESTGC